MCGEEEHKDGKDEAGLHGPRGFAEFCGGMIPPAMEECCGPRMREMMSRCMARFEDARRGPTTPGTGKKEA